MTGDRLAFLGPPGTFTHQAALALRPHAAAHAVPTPGDALGAVADGTARWAVCPIDNSVNGVVVPTLDGLLQHPGLAVVDSVVVPISFDAYTLDPAVPPTVVVSHPHGLAQCRDYIAGLGLPTREAASTAAACRDLVPGEIGIGPAVCGDLYPIRRVAAAVEDHERAHTQFALVAPVAPVAPEVGARSAAGRDAEGDLAAAPGSGSSGLLVSLAPEVNVPGLLRRLLAVLEDRGINMTNLVTRPVPATPGVFVFLLFLAGDLDGAEFERMRSDWAALGAEARALGRIGPLAQLVAAAAEAEGR